MTGAIVDLARETAPAAVTVDVCVVGSGPAGATAARELARAGREVLVVEEGGDFRGPALTQREGEMHDQLYVDRGGRATSDLGITVLGGRVLGGGSVINACDVVPIPDGVLECWRKRYGLTDLGPGALAPHRDEALRDLAASLPAEAQINENNRILREGARALGWRGEVMLHNRVGCAGLGTCFLGCPLDVKRNARTVAIPAAIEAGARFWTRARAARIEGAAAETKTVRVRALDVRGYHEREELAVRARAVVLAAGAIATAGLLLRSGIGNEHVGRNLVLQPQLPVSARFDREVRLFRGIPQVYAVTEFEDLAHEAHGWWGFRIESIGGTPGLSASVLPVFGHPGKEMMARFPRTAAALALLPDEPHGRVRALPSGRCRIDYDLLSEARARLRTAARAAARLFLAAGAREVLVPTVPPVLVRSEADLAAIDALGFEPATAPLVSAHQQGTVRMAPSARDGAASPEGEVYGTRGVYVLDSALFPTSASSHIMAPIMTVARFLAQRIAASRP